MFKIPTRVRYVVKAMIDLSENYGQGPIMLRQVAEREWVSVDDSLQRGLLAGS